MTLTLVHDAPSVDMSWIEAETIPSGSVVEYCGHIPGGMVAVLWNNLKRIIHPATTKELS